jgi:2-polyprenyl-3-methyl-5-hydroxy-6-metoxy-1,4-benzoquinol methylase
MINTKLQLEKILQDYRFKKVIPHVDGDVMDFGGNDGELQKFVKGMYTCVNYDHSVFADKQFDTIVSLAVIEHIEFDEVFKIFSVFKNVLRKHGKIFLTTPTRAAKPLLELLAFLRFLDRDNIKEHKHYWKRKEIYDLADSNGFAVKMYKKFQCGLNQMAIFVHKDSA